MLVCHCAAVNDATINQAVAAGAATVADITARCGAGGGCGGCHPVLCRLLGRHAQGACGASDCAAAGVSSPQQMVSVG